MTQYLPIIYIVAAAQGVILALALWRRVINVNSNKVLAWWLLFMVLDLTVKSIYLANDRPPMRLYDVIRFFPFLYASFFYVYVKVLINRRSFRGKDLLHFFGFMVICGANLPAVLLDKSQWLVGMRYFDVMLYVYSVVYITAGLMLIFSYRKDLQQQRADTQDIDLQWLNIMGYSQIIIWLVAISQWLLSIEGFNHWSIYIVVSMWIIMMGYLSLMQQNIPHIQPIVQPSVQPIKKSTIDQQDQRFDQVGERISQLIDDQGIHLQPNLTIGLLAKTSGYPEYLISLFINRKHEVTFHDFINQLRIDEAKNILMKSDDKRTILQVAYDCGYNSKSTFNAAFKKFTKQTPSQFRQMHL